MALLSDGHFRFLISRTSIKTGFLWWGFSLPVMLVLNAVNLFFSDINGSPEAQSLSPDLAVPRSRSAGDGHLSNCKRSSVAHSLSFSSSHCPDMTDILFIGTKIASFNLFF